jgi:hypothetical protein
MQTCDSLVPEVLDLLFADKRDMAHFNKRVLEFAAAGGAFVYPVVEPSSAFVFSPHPLEPGTVQEIYHEDQLEQVRSYMDEDGMTAEHILSGFLVWTPEGTIHYHHDVSAAEMACIAKELAMETPPESPVEAVSSHQ